jgi:hypothetical protein
MLIVAAMKVSTGLLTCCVMSSSFVNRMCCVF